MNHGLQAATSAESDAPLSSPAEDRPPSRWVKAAVSTFIVITLIAVLRMNRPQFVADRASQITDKHFSPMNAWRLRMVPWAMHWWAHALGFDNKWEMYSNLHRYEYTMVPVGIDANGTQFTLPEPLNSSRTFWQEHFTDFREVKFQLNIYRWKFEQARYCNYLLRHYPDNHGIPTRFIRLDLHYRFYIDTPEEALAKGGHLAGEEKVITQVIYPPLSQESW